MSPCISTESVTPTLGGVEGGDPGGKRVPPGVAGENPCSPWPGLRRGVAGLWLLVFGGEPVGRGGIQSCGGGATGVASPEPEGLWKGDRA